MTSPEGSVRHVLVCGGVHPDGMELLDQAQGISFEVVEDNSEQLAKRIDDADGVVMRICDMGKEMIEGATRLKVVSRHGVGCDNLPVAELTKRGIPVMITGDANSEAVAEHALYMLLALLRKGNVMDRAVRSDDWKARNRLRTGQAGGKRILVVGCGRIGRLAVSKFKALGMKVTVYDPFVDADACVAMGADKASGLHEELPEADVVSLHLPSAGKAVIGEAELGLMQAHALLINVSRGDLVDEEALAKSLRAGAIAGAGLDVFASEPPRGDHPLLGLDNTVLSPHSAALTDESMRAMGMICVQNVLDVFSGNPKRDHVFNPEVLRST